MKKCRSIKGLLHAIGRGDRATLVVYGSTRPAETAGLWGCVPDANSLTLNVFPGHIRYCSTEAYEKIKPYLTILTPPCPEEPP